jgi:hypothetical protein
MQSVDETKAALAKELAEEELKEQESLPKSSESNTPEVPLPKVVSAEDQVSSSVSTDLELGSDGRPLHEPEGNIFLTDSHESDKNTKKILTGLQREMPSRFQDRSLLLEDLKELGMAGELSDDSQHLTMAFEDVHRLVTTMRMAEVILNERVQNSRKKAKINRIKTQLIFSHPNPFDALESDDSDDDESDDSFPTPALLCSSTPSPILADSGATHVLLRESVLPSLSHLIHSATLQPMPFTLPNGSTLTAQSGGHLHFPRLPFPVPFWSAPDSVLAHSLFAISSLLQASGSCLHTPTTLSIYAPGDPTPVLVGSKRASENVWRIHIPPPPPPQPPDEHPHAHPPFPLISVLSINQPHRSSHLQPKRCCVYHLCLPLPWLPFQHHPP